MKIHLCSEQKHFGRKILFIFGTGKKSVKTFVIFHGEIFDDSIIIWKNVIRVYSWMKSSKIHLLENGLDLQFSTKRKFFKNQIQRFEISQKNLAWNLKKLKRMNEDIEWSVNEGKSQGPVIYKSRISLWTTNYLKILKIF